MLLPKIFTDKFKQLFSAEEYESFSKSFEEKIFYGIRNNGVKISAEDFEALIAKDFKAIPWAQGGYYYPKEELKDKGERLSVDPYYHCGLYYFQEPSAMFPALVLNPKPGEKVLDLCAAPGGKTTQLAALMDNKGLLIANEISPKRAKSLLKNIELMGITNTIITNTNPEKLLKRYRNFFDRVLVDAPCSGEGMFKKDPKGVKAYEKFGTEEIKGLQRSILKAAGEMLVPGGYLVYSTCTFSPEEDEEALIDLLEDGSFSLVEIKKEAGMVGGRSDWAKSQLPLSKAVRFFPHLVEGEGHFVALLQKNIKETSDSSNLKESIVYRKMEDLPLEIKSFLKENIQKELPGYFYKNQEHYYQVDFGYPLFKEHHLVNVGLYLGELNKYGFQPSQSLIMTLKPEDLERALMLSRDDDRVNRYLKGETIDFKGPKGLYGVFLDNYPLGWGKMTEQTFKNQYPKGWRKSY